MNDLPRVPSAAAQKFLEHALRRHLCVVDPLEGFRTLAVVLDEVQHFLDKVVSRCEFAASQDLPGENREEALDG